MIRIIKASKEKKRPKGQMCHSLAQGCKKKVDTGVAAIWTLMSNCGKVEVFLQAILRERNT